MSSEPETAPEPESPASDEEQAQSKPPQGAAPPPLDEATINAPSMQTLVMLSVICVSTLLMWAAGRAACNYHVPGESLTPRKVSLEERTRMPKDVGIEFAQALSGGDFATAAKLAKGHGADSVKKAKSDCRDCSARVAARSKLMSVAEVLRANSVDSIVKVRTVGGPEGEVIRFLGIERHERKWSVTRVLRSAAEGKLKEPPVRDDAPPSLRRPEGVEGADAGEPPLGSEGQVNPSAATPASEPNPVSPSSPGSAAPPVSPSKDGQKAQKAP